MTRFIDTVVDRAKFGEKIAETRDKRAKLAYDNRSRWYGTRDWPVFITFPGAPVPPRTLVWKGGAISTERHVHLEARKSLFSIKIRVNVHADSPRLIRI